MNDDVDLLLLEAGERWRSVQPEPREPAWHAIPARPGRPGRLGWLVAAAAFVVVVAAAVGLVAGPRGQRDTPAHPSAPIARPLVPYADGAVVPAPFVHAMGGPGSITYCPADELTGALAFRRTDGQLTGELRLRLKTSAKSCSLPGMLADGATALRLLDRSGTVQGHGLDPRSEFPTNVPDFDAIILNPGETATMYVQPQTGPFCSEPVVRATVRFDQQTSLTLPVTGLGGCGEGDAPTGYWYGPFSTPGQPVAFQPGSWSDLLATLDFPSILRRDQPTTFHVTLANHGPEAVALAPCPRFGIVLGGSLTASITGGSTDCPSTPQVMQPGKSITLALTYTLGSALPAGRYSVRWAIAGVGTATASTTVR